MYKGDTRVDILRNKAYKISYVRNKRKVNITERRKMVTERSVNGVLQCSRNGSISSYDC